MTAPKILIIDDEAEIVKALQIRLEMEGYQVLASYNGGSGYLKARSEHPDIIILDIVMPNLDGYQVCEKLKADESTKDIPVIMLTAKSMGKDFETAMEKKADWYVVKPFDFEHLHDKIVRLLEKKN